MSYVEPKDKSSVIVQKITTIQVMRAAAAFAVLFHHIADEGVHFWGMDQNSSLRHFIKGGMIGVDLFFILSGFIMTHISIKENTPRVFLCKRIARIIPTYWFYITLTLIATLALGTFKRSSDGNPLYIISSYLFFPTTNSNGKVFPLLDIGWTLNYEMFFYAIFSLSLFIKNSELRLKSFLVFLLIFSIIGRYIPGQYTALKFWSDQIILEFGLGIILAILYDRGIGITAVWRWVLIAVTVVFEYAVIVYYSNILNEYRFFLWGIPAAIFAAAIILGERKGKHSKWYMWMLNIGTVSYSLYLVHPFITRLITVAFLKLQLIPALWLPAILIMFITVIIAARLSYKYIESPSQRLVKRWLKVK